MKPVKFRITDAVIFNRQPLTRAVRNSVGLATVQDRHATACKLFHGTIQEFDAWEQALRDEAAANAEAARQAAHEAARAKEAAQPKPASNILPPAENMTIKRDAYRINDIATADDDAWKNLVSDKHLGLSAKEFLDRIGYADDELIGFAPGGTRRFADVKDNLDGFLRV